MDDFYSKNASRFIEEYESVPAENVHKDWLHLLPSVQSLVLDVGAGSGRDSAWLASLGHDVIAVEPAERLLSEARKIHPSPSIQWISDKLPSLKKVYELNLKFDVILVNAVWIHVAPKDRERAIRKLGNLLKPGGLLVITLRHGSSPDERIMHPGTVEDLKQLARHFLLEVVLVSENADQLKRAEVHWSTVVLKSADDGTSALPLLRHIIINDAKSSTYKLALLRVLLRIADGSQGAVLESDDNFVTIPFGLVALYWLKTYKKLVLDENLNQQPAGKHGFDKAPFRSLAEVSAYELRIGNRFQGERAKNLTLAIRDMRDIIKKMPAFFTTFPNSKDPVFPCETGRIVKSDSLELNLDFFRMFGTFKVPRHLWDSMSQYACWIEPAIVNEWATLMKKYDGEKGKSFDQYLLALAWLNEDHDTRIVRKIVDELKSRGKSVYCVWTGKNLQYGQEIDHCFPFSYWQNNDLWNLMPSHRSANNSKRDKLPSAVLLENAQERILQWWDMAYGEGGFQERFFMEAKSSLPFIRRFSDGLNFEGVFTGIQNQRIRLKTNQQISEWDG